MGGFFCPGKLPLCQGTLPRARPRLPAGIELPLPQQIGNLGHLVHPGPAP